jgi:hypothetical protein
MAKGKRGRPRKNGPRGSDDRLLREGKFTPPPLHIVERRRLFSFVTPSKGPDGRVGEIDQDVCDGIGQFHALGLLDGHGFDGTELRDIGREWRDWFTRTLRKQGFKAGGFERVDKAMEREPKHSERLDRMDLALVGYERAVLMSLLVDPIVGSWPSGEEEAPWVRSIVGEALLKRNRIVAMIGFPTAHEHGLLAASIRGLCILLDASLPRRWEQAA